MLEWRAHLAALARARLRARRLGVRLRHAAAEPRQRRRVYGAAYGFLPIGWIVLNAVFLYSLTVATGQFEIVKASVGRLSSDRRIQALLVAFSFGAFIEGASGFGTPVAICSALLIGLGFTPLYAAGLSLIANTAPVAFGAIGTPILTLAAVTGIPAHTIGMMAGRQLPFVSLIVPAWLVVTMSGWRGLRGVWPAVLVCGGTFAIVQFAWSNFVGVELVDIVGGLASIGALAMFCRVWQPARSGSFPGAASVPLPSRRASAPTRTTLASRAWMPWLFLSVAVILWGLAPVKAFLNGGPRGLAAYRSGAKPVVSRVLSPTWNVPLLHRLVFRDYPGLPAPRRSRRGFSDPAYRNERAEAAQFTVNWLSATGTAILLAALASASSFACPLAQFLAVAVATLRRMRAPLATIMLMLALGFVTRYGGTDATLGLAFTRTGVLYPFFADVPRLARRRADRLRHELERPLRQPAEDHRAAARLQSDPDRHRQQHRRRDGQDDRRPEHRRRRPRRPGRSVRKDASCGSCSGTASRSRRSWA